MLYICVLCRGLHTYASVCIKIILEDFFVSIHMNVNLFRCLYECVYVHICNRDGVFAYLCDRASVGTNPKCTDGTNIYARACI